MGRCLQFLIFSLQSYIHLAFPVPSFPLPPLHSSVFVLRSLHIILCRKIPRGPDGEEILSLGIRTHQLGTRRVLRHKTVYRFQRSSSLWSGEQRKAKAGTDIPSPTPLRLCLLYPFSSQDHLVFPASLLSPSSRGQFSRYFWNILDWTYNTMCAVPLSISFLQSPSLFPFWWLSPAPHTHPQHATRSFPHVLSLHSLLLFGYFEESWKKRQGPLHLLQPSASTPFSSGRSVFPLRRLPTLAIG